MPTLLDLLEVPYDSAAFHGRTWCAGELRKTNQKEADNFRFEPVESDVLIEWNMPEDEFIERNLYGTTGSSVDKDSGTPPVVLHLSDLGSAAELESVFRADRRCLITSDGKTKLVLSRDGDHQRYDLSNDPGEWRNRFGEDPADDEKLTERLLSQLHAVGDWVDESVESLLR